MKSILIASCILFLGSTAAAENDRAEFQQSSDRINKKEKVAEIAAEQGIDLSDEGGRQQMALYLRESGQGHLLPRKRRRSMSSGGKNNEQEVGQQKQFNGADCEKGQQNSQRRPRPRSSGPTS